jgi:hypothetical protein
MRAPDFAPSSTRRLLFDDSGVPATSNTSASRVSCFTAFWRFCVA